MAKGVKVNRVKFQFAGNVSGEGKFCRVCGKEKDSRKGSRYNVNNGNIDYSSVECDIKDCKHGYHIYKNREYKSLFKTYRWKECVECRHVDDTCGHDFFGDSFYGGGIAHKIWKKEGVYGGHP